MADVGHKHLLVMMELLTDYGSPGLIREILQPGQTQKQPGAPFPSHSVRHADPFTSEWLRDLGLPATSGHTPGRNKERFRNCWDLLQVPRLARTHWMAEIWELAASPCGGAVMPSTANITPIWLISRQYRVPVLPPPPAPVIGRRENGNLARVSRPIGEDRVS